MDSWGGEFSFLVLPQCAPGASWLMMLFPLHFSALQRGGEVPAKIPPGSQSVAAWLCLVCSLSE